MAPRGRPPGGPKYGGRRKGTPNRIKPPEFKQQMLAAQEKALERIETLTRRTPLEHCLEVMSDESYPPDLRLKAAGLALPFCHAKKAEEPNEKDETRNITEIRTIVVSPVVVEQLFQLPTIPTSA
jgi:hypothetical protein